MSSGVVKVGAKVAWVLVTSVNQVVTSKAQGRMPINGVQVHSKGRRKVPKRRGQGLELERQGPLFVKLHCSKKNSPHGAPARPKRQENVSNEGVVADRCANGGLPHARRVEG